jgi:hypothetical protein
MREKGKELGRWTQRLTQRLIKEMREDTWQSLKVLLYTSNPLI